MVWSNVPPVLGLVLVLNALVEAETEPYLPSELAQMTPIPKETSAPLDIPVQIGRYAPGTPIEVRTDPVTGDVVVESTMTSGNKRRESGPRVQARFVDTSVLVDGPPLDEFTPPYLDAVFKPTKLESASRAFNTSERNVFGKDDRFFFHSSDYPYSTFGQLFTSGGTSCSGTMIGPRHMLTAAHCVLQGKRSLYDRIWFVPCNVDNNAPFGFADVTIVYLNLTSGFNFADGRVDFPEAAFDTAVAVLDRNIGRQTGWVRVRKYRNKWNGLDVWTSLGYPDQLSTGRRPFVQVDGIVTKAKTYRRSGQVLLTRNDLTAGQSGGPIYSYFKGDQGPSVVGVHSFCGSDTNGDAGGKNMIRLAKLARKQNP